MAKRGKESNRKARGVSITAYVLPGVRRDLKKLINLIADDVDRDRLMEIGVMAAYAVTYLLAVKPDEALRIILAGKAYEESHDPDLPSDPPQQAKKPQPGSGDKGSEPKFGSKKSLPHRIASRPVKGAVADGPAALEVDGAPVGGVVHSG